jgi:anti-sigma factor RsiW
MNCAQAQRELQLYMDGRLDQRRFYPLEAHLDICERCQDSLKLYEIMQEALTDPLAEKEPANLTALIMARIAVAEKRRTTQVAQPFDWQWRDALLAALLGTTSTLLFLVINPALRTTFFMTIAHSFPMLATLIQANGPGAIPWIACIVWITVGVGLTLWLAGAEVRAAWKRSLTHRIQTRPQFRQLW